MSSTFRIIQSECHGCPLCVDASEERIIINDEGLACFACNGKDTASIGTDEAHYIFEAIDVCPRSCIEEYG